MNIEWVRIRSWHAVAPSAGEGDTRGNRTRCGRRYASTAEQVDTLPASRSCESCLRSVARSVDAYQATASQADRVAL